MGVWGREVVEFVEPGVEREGGSEVEEGFRRAVKPAADEEGCIRPSLMKTSLPQRVSLVVG